MAVHIQGIFERAINEKITTSKILIVGAGGIGCELLKNLVLTGFENLFVIDLDTIELSNLNRQFLFHKQHIGRPKAVVAKESVLKFNPKAQITAYHDSITNPEYDAEFFGQFSVVANALDNVAARSHVNRMCLAADVPLIESGTAGYLGQVTVYKKKITECFECLTRKGQKTYPGCTIRNTPSEPVHCIVWAKHLFNQLFGETDADEEVSPDAADPELNTTPSVDGNVSRVSTREWAKESNYDPVMIFNKLFGDDIDYLNRMNDLWVKRKRPRRLNYNDLPDAVPSTSQQRETPIKDQMLWSIKQCSEVFCKSLIALKKKLESVPDNIFAWDKDDDDSMDFVASVANIRSYCFCIPQKSRFDIKSIAGNIVPAIATTNAVIAGLIVLQMIKVLKGDFTKCKTAWLKESGVGGKILSSSQLEKPNPKCFVCSSTTPEVSIKLDCASLTLKTLNEKVLREKLHLAQPDVVINDGTGKILISSDPEDMTDDMMEKVLSDFNIKPSSRLLCEDFVQHYKLNLIICPKSGNLKDQEFEILTDVESLISQKNNEGKKENSGDSKNDSDSHNSTEKSGSANEIITNADMDEIELLPDEELKTIPIVSPTKKAIMENKRKLSDDENGVELFVGKKRKTETD